ncbi:MAG: iron-containing alcohol dehydrogenase [Vicinamibacterales bacterium]
MSHALTPESVHVGPGTLERLGEITRALGITRALIVSDPGILVAGYVDRARRLLEAAGVEAHAFHDFSENPDTAMVEAGRRAAAPLELDGLVGLGGGSSLDCAKGINFVLTNGGSMADYRGYGKASKPMLPMIGVPTTAGTGSEAQTYAVISDAVTHVKMACGDPKAGFAAVVLDPELTISQPPHVTAAAGYDALSHAVETWVTTKRTGRSDARSREAWRLLSGSYERVLAAPHDLGAREAMLVGAYLAGAAIEQSMLGATHACANPLTARYGTTHGVAIAMLLRHVVRWNAADPAVAARYELLASNLAERLEAMVSAGQFPEGLAAAGASKDDLETLARDAAGQWTGTFNPRPFDARGACEIYEMAW